MTTDKHDLKTLNTGELAHCFHLLVLAKRFPVADLSLASRSFSCVMSRLVA